MNIFSLLEHHIDLLFLDDTDGGAWNLEEFRNCCAFNCTRCKHECMNAEGEEVRYFPNADDIVMSFST